MVATVARFSQSIGTIVVASSRHTAQRGFPALHRKRYWAAPSRDAFRPRHAPRDALTARPQHMWPAPKAPMDLSQLAPTAPAQVKLTSKKPFKSHKGQHPTPQKKPQLNPYDYIPKPGRRGLWDGPAGDSGWHSAVPAMLSLTWGQPVQYCGGYPDFAPWARVTLTFGPNELHGKKDGTTADMRWAQLLGVEPQVARTKRQQERLDWHHVEDGRTMQLLPIPIHHNCAHTGGASVLRHSQTPGVVQQQVEGLGWGLTRLRHLMSTLGSDSQATP